MFEAKVSQLLTPPQSERSSLNPSNHGKESLDGDQGSLHGQQVVHQDPPYGVLSDEAQIEKLQGRSAMFAHTCGEHVLAREACKGQIVIEESNGTVKMSTDGNVKVATQTFASGDQRNLGDLLMGGIRKIITEGTTTLEFAVKEDITRKSGHVSEDKIKNNESAATSENEDKSAGGNKDEYNDYNRCENKVEGKAQDEDEAAPKANPRYDTAPLYVKELTDTIDGELLLRETSSEPFGQGTFQPMQTDPHPHVIEILVVRSARLSSYAAENDKKEALHSGKITMRGIRIISPLLKHALSMVINYYPGFSITGKLICRWPYMAILHHRKDLEDLKLMTVEESLKEEAEERNKHVDCLLQFIEKDLGEAFAEENARHLQNPPVATFEYYWILLKPGTVVYRKTDDIWSAWVVKSFDGGLEDGIFVPYEVTLWNICFDGQQFGRCIETHIIHPWEGEQDIRSMDLYPAEMHDESQVAVQPSMREKLIERGKKYVNLAHQSHCDYRGRCLVHPKRTYNSAVMIDTAMRPWEDSEFKAWKPVIESGTDGIVAGCTCSACLGKIEARKMVPYLFLSCDKISLDSEFTDEQYLICTYWVFGYILSARRWEILSIDNLQEHQDNSDYIEKLVISAENLHMIKAICRTYARDHVNSLNASWSADMIQGKGEGQIFLLHGKPGVGKTLTAECVAEYTRRPLLSLTPGDIGTDPVTVDKTLAKYFKLGESWGAIVLLDEADVYLEARNLHDLERNSLVSVFLRAMEYYQGILFLTTNRVGSFDEAFASRIHVQLYYDDLDSGDRSKIYDNLVEKLELDREDVSVESRTIDYLKENKAVQEMGWNGRQIRNAFQTAVSLAEYDASEAALSSQPCKHCKKPGHALESCWIKYPQKKGKKVFVKPKHIEMAANMSGRFQSYLKSAKGGEDSKLAAIGKLRADDFGKKAVKG